MTLYRKRVCYMKQFTVKKLASSAMVAAAYAALTLILFPISYGNIQFRLS